LKNKKRVDYTAEHKCWYIIQDGTGHVITSQCKAWMDTVRMAMMIDLIWKPINDTDRGMLVWMDNCGSHKTAAIEALLGLLKIYVALFPKNMTAILQMLDLIVNGPIKQNIRTKRAKTIYNAFREFKTKYDVEANKSAYEAAKSGRKEMHFRHPKPNLEECIKDLMELFVEGRGKFTEERFQNSVMNTMVQTGCCPIFTYPPPETEEELKAREFILYEEAMSLSNNSTNAMQCIPRGCAPAIVAVKGSDQIDAEAQALHEEMVAMFNAHLVETDSEGSESDDNQEDDLDDDEFYGEEENTDDESEEDI